MRFPLIFVLIAMATSSDIKSLCKTWCPKNLKPLCAADENGLAHYFPNECKYDIANCKRREQNLTPLKNMIYGDCRKVKRILRK